MTPREKTKKVMVGNVPLGGGSPITVQSMLNVPAGDVEGNVAQAQRLEQAGCEILRVAVPTAEDARLVTAIKEKTTIPLVADIHFDYKIALACAERGVDKIRINPGNIGDDDRVKAVAIACRERGIPIRIGVNSGSVEKHILAKYGSPTPEALCESALYHVSLLERFDFTDIVVALKSSHVPTMAAAYRRMSELTPYPLHLGVTESGTLRSGLLKSGAGIGSLLLDGIGDTIRISLTSDPVEEVAAAKELLRALDLRRQGAALVSCPTCGRTQIGLISLAEQVEDYLRTVDKPITVAVMGCAVNGPGEAREADIGIAGGKKEGLIFKKGQILRKVPESQLLEELKKEIELL